MAQRTVAQSAGAACPGGSGGAHAQPASPWWRVSWSEAAALRAMRVTIVVPCLFALTFKVIGDAQMTLFAVFGSFAQLITVTFGGTRRDKAVAHLGLAVAGGLAVTVGTVASGSALLAALVTIPVAFPIYFAGSAGPSAAASVTPCLFAYILPIASTGTVRVLPSRVDGWLLASAANTLAVLLLSPRPSGDRLRALAARLAIALADWLAAAAAGRPATTDGEAAMAAKDDLISAWLATPYRPIGLATADQGLTAAIHLLEGCTSLIADAADGHLDLPAAAPADRELLTDSVQALREVGAVLSGQQVEIDLEPVHQARIASASSAPTTVPLPRSRISAAALAPIGQPAALQPGALWVGLHLDSLAAHAAGLIEPAKRVASMRRRPWWR
jgi:hypothetical protein